MYYLCSVKSQDAYRIVAEVALVVELVDTPDLGSGAARRVGSSPIRRTIMAGAFDIESA